MAKKSLEQIELEYCNKFNKVLITGVIGLTLMVGGEIYLLKRTLDNYRSARTSYLMVKDENKELKEKIRKLELKVESCKYPRKWTFEDLKTLILSN